GLQQTSPAGRRLPSFFASSGLDGSFSFPGALQGDFTLNAQKRDVNGVGSALGRLDLEGQVVDVPLVVKIVRPIFGTIAGQVFNADGSPAALAFVSVCHPGRCENEVGPALAT